MQSLQNIKDIHELFSIDKNMERKREIFLPKQVRRHHRLPNAYVSVATITNERYYIKKCNKH